MIDILIVDDHDIFIDGLVSLLTGTNQVRVIATGCNGEEAVCLAREHPEAAVLVLDVSMPVMDGISALALLRRERCMIPVLMLTQELSGGTIARAMRAGAAGYILKTAGLDEFMTAIRSVAGGGEYLCEKAQASLIARLTGHRSGGDEPELTRRELEILRLVAGGLTTKQIADQLFISTYTVETHRRNLLQKLGVKNAAGLARYAIDHGLVDE